jgi:hypothetical protein
MDRAGDVCLLDRQAREKDIGSKKAMRLFIDNNAKDMEK